MLRKPRFYLPKISVHLGQRGHFREPVLFETGKLKDLGLPAFLGVIGIFYLMVSRAG